MCMGYSSCDDCICEVYDGRGSYDILEADVGKSWSALGVYVAGLPSCFVGSSAVYIFINGVIE